MRNTTISSTSPSLYFEYDSLKSLRDDLTYNALKKIEILKRLTAKGDSPVIGIKSAKVQAVMKNPEWPGVIVMTYMPRSWKERSCSDSYTSVRTT